MAKFIIISNHQEAFDTEEEAVAYIKSGVNYPIGATLAGNGPNGPIEHKTLIVSAEVVRTLTPSVATGSGGDHHLFNTQAFREEQRKLWEHEGPYQNHNRSGMTGQQDVMYAKRGAY